MAVYVVKRGGEGHTMHYIEAMISSESDVANLPNRNTQNDKADPGSVAYLQDMSKLYMLGIDNTWREVG